MQYLFRSLRNHKRRSAPARALSTEALPGLPDQTATGHAPRRGVQTNKDTDTDNCDLKKQFCTNKGEIIVSVNII